MDIKLKNSRRIRTILGIIFLIVLTLGNLTMFPQIAKKAEEEIRKETLATEEEIWVSDDNIDILLRAGYVLYYDMLDATEQGKLPFFVDEIIADWREQCGFFYRQIDYWADIPNKDFETNTFGSGILKDGEWNSETAAYLQERYDSYLAIEFDETGAFSVEEVWTRHGNEGEVVRVLFDAANEVERKYRTEYNEYLEDASVESGIVTGVPENFRVLFAMQNNYPLFEGGIYDDYWHGVYTYGETGSVYLYWGSVVIILIAVLFLTSNFIWHKTVDHKRKGPWYFMELAVIGLATGFPIQDEFYRVNYMYGKEYLGRNIIEILKGGVFEDIVFLGEFAGFVFLVYLMWYLSFLFIRPIFSLGVKEYIRQYSFIYMVLARIAGFIKRCWKKLKYQVEHLDFSEKNTKVIRNVVIANFIVLAVISCFWVAGIIPLIIYSIALFFYLKNQYEKVGTDYKKLLEATSRMGQGDLQYKNEEDWGLFEPFKDEIDNIRSGFSKAVAEEVKSQRMKTELITNVSHDLKTPLTAITTYVELLKDPNLTEEQRNSYIEILEKKSLRLKILVEDLFEVSKANSENIKLDLMEVDVVNLLKQVSVEHDSRFEEKGISLKWNVPSEKICIMLDNQKTYRIFENLFVNIEKYAMENSRVYVDVLTEEGVQIVIRNISAQELSVSGEEITERFVRGDDSRTTEGSGLGLAIAKSFTEAQGGTFAVVVDGDLFKVMICWK